MNVSSVQANAKACGQLSWLIAAISWLRGPKSTNSAGTMVMQVTAVMACEARQRHEARSGDVVYGGAASGK